jgi:TetR/AcrR family transcriptional regulator, transcriptional repressor for nem operon
VKLAANTKTEIMRFAEREIASKGVHGFSFRDVAFACHIKSSSVHYHFPKKNDLIVAVLEEFVGRLKLQFETWTKEEAHPEQRLKRYLGRMRELARECSSRTFCPMMMVATEVGATDPEVTRVTRIFFGTAIQWLAEQLRSLRGHLEPTPEDLFDAELMYNMLEGGMISVRMTGEPGRIETVLRTIEKQVLGTEA